ncbi:MFS transporter [soil metagenome]
MNMTSKAGAAPRSQGFARGLVILLALAIFIHSLDRGNLGTAGPLIRDQLHISNSAFGVLQSSYFWVYVPGQLFAGWVIARLNAYRTLALGLLIWSAATFLTGLAGGFVTLFVLRLFVGLGECAGFPASSKLLAQHVPAHRLGYANALVAAGLMLGNGVGTLAGGLLIAQLGWRALFFVFGALSLLWLVPWLTVTRGRAAVEAATPMTGREPRFREIFARRELWGASLGHFAANYPYFLLLAWLPIYLVKAQGYSLSQMAVLGGVVYALSAGCGLVGGAIADRWIARGASVNRVRKTMIITGGAISFCCMAACALGGPKLAIAGLLLFSVSNGLGSSNVFAIGQTLAGPRAAGKWIGVQNALGGISGIVGPMITGFIIDATGSFRLTFVVAAAIALVGILSWVFVVRRIEPLVWADM